jgi:hypothetical protein
VIWSVEKADDLPPPFLALTTCFFGISDASTPTACRKVPTRETENDREWRGERAVGSLREGGFRTRHCPPGGGSVRGASRG